MHLLLIEDDAEAARFLAKGLRESGYVVDIAADGREGLFRATEGSYDLIVADRQLPHFDGLSIVAMLRKSGRRTPVLILSALGSVDDKIAGLRAGGDDYLAKPFAFGELLARIEALLRRGNGPEVGTRIRIADLELDWPGRKVTRDTQRDACASTPSPARPSCRAISRAACASAVRATSSTRSPAPSTRCSRRSSGRPRRCAPPSTASRTTCARRRGAGLTVTCDAAAPGPAFVVTGNRQLLAQLITNLLENTLKYVPATGHVQVRVRAADDAVTLTVADDGPGITAADREAALRPFVRVGESAAKTAGSGLGLSLAAAVARLHRAQLTLDDNAPGLLVTCRFPSAARRDERSVEAQVR